MNFFQSFLQLLYPNVCPGCGNQIAKNKETICLSCWVKLPKTYQYLDAQNTTAKMFWGRFPLEMAFATYKYSKEGIIQNIIHDLKYRGNRKVGEKLGIELGKEILLANLTIDIIIAVPMHVLKEQKRGYNQSLEIAKGIQSVLGCKLETKVLLKVKNTETQTRKTKFERYKNAKEVFQTVNFETIKGKHVLLVDDVITTGATIEDCCLSLVKEGTLKISVVAIACA